MDAFGQMFPFQLVFSVSIARLEERRFLFLGSYLPTQGLIQALDFHRLD